MFFKTPEFVQVFGDAEISESCRCSGMSNIDLVPANILLQDSGVSVIDYEWTFRFPIPCNFILYRMIHYYLESDGKRAVLRDLDFYKRQESVRKNWKFMQRWSVISRNIWKAVMCLFGKCMMRFHLAR